MAIAETAYAKINLYLHVTAIRPDGYHELDSLFVFADCGDRLTFEPSDRLSLKVTGAQAAQVPDGPDNLVMRAATALQQQAGIETGALITLDKVLPVASGIGGGSADAAATLRGLSRLWALGLDDRELEQLGASLGADIPACIRSLPVQVAGIGDILTPAPAGPEAWIVLANPGVPISTPDVFRLCDQSAMPRGEVNPPEAVGALTDWVTALATRDNDLQPAAIEIAPVVSAVIDRIASQPGCLLARMSGSGATCFGLFADGDQAAQAAGALKREQPDWWSVAAPLRSAAG